MKSRKPIALAVLSLVLLAMPATAGFTGDTVSVNYEWPAVGSFLYSGGTFVVASSGTNFTLPNQGGTGALVTDTNILISYPGGWLFNTTTPRTFDGWVLTDLQANITGVSSIATNISGFTVSFDSHHVYISKPRVIDVSCRSFHLCESDGRDLRR